MTNFTYVGVYFVKRDAQPLPEGENINYANHLAWGDIHPNVLGNISLKKVLIIIIILFTVYIFIDGVTLI